MNRDADAPNIVSPRAAGDDVPSRRACGAMFVHRRLLNASAAYRDARCGDRERHPAPSWPPAGRNSFEGPVRIPVVVHVVWNTDAQNISDEQVHSQIEVLNQDFRAHQRRHRHRPAALRGADRRQPRRVRAGDAPTRTASRRRASPGPRPTSTAFDSDDGVKSSATGGVDPWPTRPLPQHVGLPARRAACSATRSSPVGRPRPTAWSSCTAAFGTTGTAKAPPSTSGRTATHEIGHYLNLFHIWGDDGTGCGGTDEVADTPNAGRAELRGARPSRTSPAATGRTATCSTTSWTTPTTRAWSCSPPARRPAWRPASTASAPRWCQSSSVASPS